MWLGYDATSVVEDAGRTLAIEVPDLIPGTYELHYIVDYAIDAETCDGFVACEPIDAGQALSAPIVVTDGP